MNRSFVSILIVILILSFIVTGCAHQQKNVEESITLDLMKKDQLIGKFGLDQKLNPFVAPSGILRGKPYEFIVFKISSNLKAENKAQVFFDVESSDIQANIQRWDIEQFIEFWRSWDAGEAKTSNRESLIIDYYLQGNSVTLKKGRNEFYIVLIGKHPLTLPISITTELQLVGRESISKKFTIE